MTLFDLDDFDQSERSDADFQRLVQLKEECPTLKVTLFTIPENSSKLFWLTMARHSEWIDLVQHGWHHRTNYECLAWTKADCKAALRRGREKSKSRTVTLVGRSAWRSSEQIVSLNPAMRRHRPQIDELGRQLDLSARAVRTGEMVLRQSRGMLAETGPDPGVAKLLDDYVDARYGANTKP